MNKRGQMNEVTFNDLATATLIITSSSVCFLREKACKQTVGLPELSKKLIFVPELDYQKFGLEGHLNME